MDPNPLDSLPPPGANPLDSLPPPQATQAPQAPQAAQPTYSFSDFAKDYGSAAIRPVVKAVAGLPLMAMDAGVAARNLVTGNVDTSSLKSLLFGSEKNTGATDLPSATFNQALDSVTRAPTTTAGKIAEFGSTVLAGARLPGPTEIGGGAYKAPDSFNQAPQMLRNDILQRSQDEGYVVPPSTNNPTFMNRLLTGISGKQTLAREASVRNQAVTDRLSATGIQQNPDAPITQGALSAIRSEADVAGYAPVRAAGEMNADSAFAHQVGQLVQAGSGAARMGIRQASPFDETAQGLTNLTKFDAADGLDSLKYLRSLADDAFGSGNSTLGRQYKGAASALEDLIERNLQSRGQDGATMLGAFRGARQLMAQTYTAGNALKGETGNFNAQVYANEAARGKPLVGDQRTIADFATAFPKAARLMQDDVPAISPLDAYGSAIAAGASHSVAPLLLPLSRVGIREYLLSSAGQARAIPQVYRAADPVMGGLASLGIQVSNYMDQ